MVVIITKDSQLERFNNLKINKKIAVYYKDCKIQNVLVCDRWNELKYRYENDFNWPYCANTFLINSRGEASIVDWISFLNGERDFIRYEI